MPTYSYRCTDCGHEFEKVQRISEDPERVCPTCGHATAQRQINSANFILKGSGWYSDRYSGGSNKKTADASTAKDAEAKPATGDAAGTAAGVAPPSTTGSAPGGTPGGAPGGGAVSGTPATSTPSSGSSGSSSGGASSSTPSSTT